MKPPYRITPEILKLVADISASIGALTGPTALAKPLRLRKADSVRTIHHTLKIEGNSLTEEQVTAVLAGRRVMGKAKDIREVLNVAAVYEQLHAFDPASEKDFLRAHGMLMDGLIAHPGKYRTQVVGIAKGEEVQHIAPPHERVPFLMRSLFGYVADAADLALIQACVFHYEMELIHPFVDGNGRMGRLWQALILGQTHPSLAHLSIETLVSAQQSGYYQALAESDRDGESTPFLTFMLTLIRQALEDELKRQARRATATDRLYDFAATARAPFSRRDYLAAHPNLSTATASRDLHLGLSLGLLVKRGEGNQSRYEINPERR